MNTIDSLLKQYRGEVLTAAQSFYIWKSINNIASTDSTILRRLNQNALSWNAVMHSLQTTFLITLGRIFDTDPGALTISSFLRSCQTHIAEFDKSSLEVRKRKTGGAGIDKWLPAYMAGVYEPRKEDFRDLSRAAKPFRRTYEQIYKPIRNKVVAHKELSALDAGPLFARTSIGDIQNILFFLHRVERVIWELYENGHYCALTDFSLDEENRVYADVKSLLGGLLN